LRGEGHKPLAFPRIWNDMRCGAVVTLDRSSLRQLASGLDPLGDTFATRT